MLTRINFYGCQIEYYNPSVLRFINNIRYNGGSIYNDNQSVHNSSIQLCVKESYDKLLNIKPIIVNAYDYILNDNILIKENIIEFCNDKTVHSLLNITFEEAFISVINEIEKNEHKDEIKKILNNEMKESECKCFTGRITRLINCLNGFSEKVNVNISENEQISNIIINIINTIEKKDRKRIAIERLSELGITNYQDWINNLE